MKNGNILMNNKLIIIALLPIMSVFANDSDSGLITGIEGKNWIKKGDSTVFKLDVTDRLENSTASNLIVHYCYRTTMYSLESERENGGKIITEYKFSQIFHIPDSILEKSIFSNISLRSPKGDGSGDVYRLNITVDREIYACKDSQVDVKNYRELKDLLNSSNDLDQLSEEIIGEYNTEFILVEMN